MYSLLQSNTWKRNLVYTLCQVPKRKKQENEIRKEDEVPKVKTNMICWR